MDILTVVFKEELPYLKTQGQSCDLYLNDETSIIHVIVNDEDAVCGEIDKAWWGRHANRVNIIPRSNWNMTYHPDGWVSQQSLKLLGTSLSNADWCLILDAKTWFVSPFYPQSYISDDGRIKCGAPFTIHRAFLNNSTFLGDLLGIKFDTVLNPGGVPHWFNPPTVRELLTRFEELFHEKFDEFWLNHYKVATEFVLYSAYLYYRDGSLDKMHSIDDRNEPQIRANNFCHSDISEADWKLSRIVLPEITHVGMHRRAWPQLSKEQQQKFIQIMSSRGLTFTPTTSVHTGI
jgi:hypothetical protein